MRAQGRVYLGHVGADAAVHGVYVTSSSTACRLFWGTVAEVREVAGRIACAWVSRNRNAGIPVFSNVKSDDGSLQLQKQSAIRGNCVGVALGARFGSQY